MATRKRTLAIYSLTSCIPYGKKHTAAIAVPAKALPTTFLEKNAPTEAGAMSALATRISGVASACVPAAARFLPNLQ
jgi:hypothetical protein